MNTYSLLWVTICVLQDFLINEGYGFPCILTLLSALCHLPFFTLMVLFKVYQVVYTFRPELRTTSNMRVYNMKFFYLALAGTSLATIVIAIILIFSFSDRYIDPLRSRSIGAGGIREPIGGRECSQFQDWFVYMSISLTFVYFSRQITKLMQNVNDYWGVGAEMRSSALLVVLFNLPFHATNLLAWFDVFDRPAFESKVCPIAYFWVLYHLIAIKSTILKPLWNQHKSLTQLVRQQRQQRHRKGQDSQVHSFDMSYTGMTWDDKGIWNGTSATNESSTYQLPLAGSLEVPTSPSHTNSSVITVRAPSSAPHHPSGNGGASHLCNLLNNPRIMTLFEDHARRAFSSELTLFWTKLRAGVRKRHKWCNWLQLIQEERKNMTVSLSPFVKELTPLPAASPAEPPVPLHPSSTSLPTFPPAATIVTTTGATTTTSTIINIAPAHDRAQSVSYRAPALCLAPSFTAPATGPKLQYFDNDEEAYILLHHLDTCWTLYIRRGSMYEQNVPSSLYQRVKRLHEDLVNSSFWPLVSQITDEMIEDNESGHELDVITELPTSSSNHPNCHHPHQLPSNAPNSASTWVPFSRIRSITRVDPSPSPMLTSSSIPASPIPPMIATQRPRGSSISKDSWDQPSTHTVCTTTPSQEAAPNTSTINPADLVTPLNHSSHPPNVIASLDAPSQCRTHHIRAESIIPSLPDYPDSSPCSLALKFLRVFLLLETEVLTLMTTNLYESFVASEEFKRFKMGQEKEKITDKPKK